jgi:hypothetical protein
MACSLQQCRLSRAICERPREILPLVVAGRRSGLQPGRWIEALLAGLHDPLLLFAKPHARTVLLAPYDGGWNRGHLVDDEPERRFPIRNAIEREAGPVARNIHHRAGKAGAVASELGTPIGAHTPGGRGSRACRAAKGSDVAAEFGVHVDLSASLIFLQGTAATGSRQRVLKGLDKILDEPFGLFKIGAELSRNERHELKHH